MNTITIPNYFTVKWKIVLCFSWKWNNEAKLFVIQWILRNIYWYPRWKLRFPRELIKKKRVDREKKEKSHNIEVVDKFTRSLISFYRRDTLAKAPALYTNSVVLPPAKVFAFHRSDKNYTLRGFKSWLKRYLA